MFSVEVVCMGMEGVFWSFYVVERDRKTTFDPFLSMFLWGGQRVLGIFRVGCWWFDNFVS